MRAWGEDPTNRDSPWLPNFRERKSMAPEPTETAVAATLLREAQYTQATQGFKMSAPVDVVTPPQWGSSIWVGSNVESKSDSSSESQEGAESEESTCSGEPESNTAVAEPDSRDEAHPATGPQEVVTVENDTDINADFAGPEEVATEVAGSAYATMSEKEARVPTDLDT